MRHILLTALAAASFVAASTNFSPMKAAETTPAITSLTVTGSAVDEGDGSVRLQTEFTGGVQIMLADPTVYAENGRYYMSGTHNYAPTGFSLLQSDDLRHWTYARPDSMVLLAGSNTWTQQNFWAPQIVKDNDTYWMAYAANEQVCLAKATSVAGDYTEVAATPWDNSEKNIDPFIFRDDDGKYYMYHVRFGGGNFLHVSEIDPQTMAIKPGTTKRCFSATEAWENTGKYGNTPIMEGPTVIKLDGTYYLFYSANHYMSIDYAVGYATASSPTGPWTKHPNSPIIHRDFVGEKGSGHGDIFQDADGNLRYVYHVHNSDTQVNPRRARIITLNVDKSKGQPYSITADPKTIITPLLYRNNPEGIFTGYMRLKPGSYSFTGTAADGTTVTLGDDGSGNLTAGGTPFSETDSRVVRVKVNTRTGEITITPAGDLQVKGSVIKGTTSLDYVGNGVWSSEIEAVDLSSSQYLNRYVFFAFDGSNAKAWKRVPHTSQLASVEEGETGENIRLNKGRYTVTVDLMNRTFAFDAPIDPLRISVFGSSVANGQGSTNWQGYAWLYGRMLENRAEKGTSPNAFYTSGVAIGGNTVSLLNQRRDDLMRDFGKYVIIGLSLANEGLHNSSNPGSLVESYATGLQGLVDWARAEGKVPVVMNCYSNGEYTSSEYASVIDMNTRIHQWDVPSFNTLGAIDNGRGQWADGFMKDNGHPNDQGHAEMMYSMVPSLFDALAQDKPMPTRDSSKELTLSDGATLSFTPEETLHSFTITLRVKGATPGTLLSFTHGSRHNKTGYLTLNELGQVTYTPPTSAEPFTASNKNMAQGDYHYITLTHYYALGMTRLYIDKRLAGSVEEKLLPGTFTIGDSENPVVDRTVSEVAFWRAGMSLREISLMPNNKMANSSLEIYAPADAECEEAQGSAAVTDDGTRTLDIPNRALSTNRLILTYPSESAIGETLADPTAVPVAYFTADGRRIEPYDANGGIFIVKYSDGTARKIAR